MNIWHDIDPKRVTSKEFIAIVEITSESKNKYECVASSWLDDEYIDLSPYFKRD